MVTRLFAIALSALMIWSSCVVNVSAAIIETGDVIAVETRAARLADVQAQLARDDVAMAMLELGVDPAEAQLRVESLSDEELVALQGQLDGLPAGGGLLALLGAVFVVLLVLELLGVTNVFTKA